MSHVTVIYLKNPHQLSPQKNAHVAGSNSSVKGPTNYLPVDTFYEKVGFLVNNCCRTSVCPILYERALYCL